MIKHIQLWRLEADAAAGKIALQKMLQIEKYAQHGTSEAAEKVSQFSKAALKAENELTDAEVIFLATLCTKIQR